MVANDPSVLPTVHGNDGGGVEAEGDDVGADPPVAPVVGILPPPLCAAIAADMLLCPRPPSLDIAACADVGMLLCGVLCACGSDDDIVCADIAADMLLRGGGTTC